MGGGASKSIPETSEEQALAGVAQQSFARQQGLYQPLVNKYIGVAKDSNAPVQQAKNAANVSTEQAFAPATRQAVGGALATGRDPGSTLAQMSLAKTASKGIGQATAADAGLKVALGRDQALIGYGRGQATNAVTGTEQLAGSAQQQAEYQAQLAANQSANIGALAYGTAGIAAKQYDPGKPSQNQGGGF